jgi:hypothetical protein
MTVKISCSRWMEHYDEAISWQPFVWTVILDRVQKLVPFSKKKIGSKRRQEPPIDLLNHSGTL